MQPTTLRLHRTLISLTSSIALSLFLLFAVFSSSYAQNADLPKTITLLVHGNKDQERGLKAQRLVPLMAKYAPKTQFQIWYSADQARPTLRERVINAPRDGSVLTITISLDITTGAVLSPEKTPFAEYVQLVDVILMEPIICMTYPGSPFEDYKVFFKTLKEKPSEVRHPTLGKQNAFFASFFLRQIGVKYDDLTRIGVPNGETPSGYVSSKKADFVCNSAGHAIPMIESGKLTPIFSNSVHQIVANHHVPTVRDIGFKYIEDYTYWVAIAAPKGTHPEAMKKLRKLLKSVSDDPAWKNMPEMKYGISPIGKIKDPQAFANEQIDFYEKIFLSSKYLSQ